MLVLCGGFENLDYFKVSESSCWFGFGQLWFIKHRFRLDIVRMEKHVFHNWQKASDFIISWNFQSNLGCFATLGRDQCRVLEEKRLENRRSESNRDQSSVLRSPLRFPERRKPEEDETGSGVSAKVRRKRPEKIGFVSSKIILLDTENDVTEKVLN